MENVHNVVKNDGSLAYKLIELGIILDSPKPLPRAQLKELNDAARKDNIASRVIELMVMNRLYLFKTSERDMQWLSEELGIDLSRQHAITYAVKETKRLN